MNPKLLETYDVAAVRAEFPILDQEIHGHPLAYLDNAASSQKPKCVVEAISNLYERDYSNIHRGVHELSNRSTCLYEEAREAVRDFINAGSTREIVFVRGTTEAINLVAQSYGRPKLGPGDEIVLTTLEHHSNIVPWQLLAQQTGAEIRVVPIDDTGAVRLEDYEKELSRRTRIVAVSHTSNALGTILPVQEMIRLAHERGAVVLLDGAQAVPHLAVDVRALDVDFYAFSGHKMYGPSGIGALYAKEALLESMPPYMGGGDMIRTVTFEKTEYNELPFKFEAGTPNISGAVGLRAAIEFLNRVDIEAIYHYETKLLEAAMNVVHEIPGVRIYGTAPAKAALVSFTIDGVHPHDIGTILDQQGVAVRAGHHCAQPVMDRFGVPATTRASFGCYNTVEEIERLARAIHHCKEVFGCV